MMSCYCLTIKHRQYVAVVDDEADLANLFTDALNSHGIKAIAFSDPIEAIHHIRDHHNQFWLVITDWRMPSISGLELAKLVRKMDDEIRIALMSAFELEKDQLKEIQIHEYLRKPMRIKQLVQAVKELLNEPQLLTGFG